jgi:hypothetical protein
LLALLATGLPAAASPADDYTNAVHRALTLVQFAERGDEPSREQALQVLDELPGPPQPEILRELRAEPPELHDAGLRLQALFTALQARVDTPDPQRAQEELNRVLTMPRYAGLGSGPSLVERLIDGALGVIDRLLSFLGVGGLHLNVPLWVWLALAGLAVAGIILWPIRDALSRGGRERAIPRGVAAVRPAVDFFAEADRLASGGDYLAAIRALAGGVAVKLSGERAWEHSPFTVRELFARSEHPDRLRPLLRSFEEASYGNRPGDAATYSAAAEAAQPYRRNQA